MAKKIKGKAPDKQALKPVNNQPTRTACGPAGDPLNPLLVAQAKLLNSLHQQEIEKLEAQHAQELAEERAVYRAQLNILLQLAEDTCLISTQAVRGLGPANATILRNEFRKTINEISSLMVEDSKDDPDIEWSRVKVDQRLAQIEGPESSREWDDRFAWTTEVIR